jgi:hypothetical protein
VGGRPWIFGEDPSYFRLKLVRKCPFWGRIFLVLWLFSATFPIFLLYKAIGDS